MLSEVRIAELARDTARLYDCCAYALPDHIEDAIRQAVAETTEACANLSPNGCDVSAADAPHVVWEKYSNGIRRAATGNR